jgi:hypothetical protein
VAEDEAMKTDLFGPVPLPHKTAVRERLLAMPCGDAIVYYHAAYKLCRAIPNRPTNWQANIRDEIHRLRDRGYFTERKDSTGTIYIRTNKREDDNGP